MVYTRIYPLLLLSLGPFVRSLWANGVPELSRDILWPSISSDLVHSLVGRPHLRRKLEEVLIIPLD